MNIKAHAACEGHIWTSMLCAMVLLICVLVPVSAQARPRLFGTVEFQMALKKQQNWLSAIERNRKKPIFFDEKRFNASTLWKDLKSRADGKPLQEKLNIVNRFWNMWPYRTDKDGNSADC